MSRIIRNGIYYDGISDYISYNIDCYSYKNIYRIITLKENFPPVSEIMKVKIIYNPKDKRIVKTAKGKSLEGEELTGLKLLSEGEFIIRIDYSCEELNGCIYILKEKLYFNNDINLSNEYSIKSKIVDDLYIEDVYVEKVDERNLIVNIIYIFVVKKY